MGVKSSYLCKQSRGTLHFRQAATSRAKGHVASQKMRREKSLFCVLPAVDRDAD
jgi:hypothetical protein